MDVIIAYLDTMFSPYPATPRLEEAKAELRAMMEDKYSELLASGRSHNEAVGQVITEFGNLDELAAVLGIAAELQGGATPTAGQAGDPAANAAAGQPGAMTAAAAAA
ncbi:MAG: permease prefix domain 1-containing protein, partial [Actinomyces sp.]|nr:permease prefix domain 1-containing protein [Actinomyces sp.]